MKVLSVIVLLFLSIYQGYADDVNRSVASRIDGWIKSYEQQILYAKSYGLKQHLVIKAFWDRYIIPEHDQEPYVSECDLVQPLLFSFWHQGYPYNLHCPDGPGGMERFIKY